jgi:GR25 family glycosyltransferase involved in LPS biosynthesis
MNTNEICDFYCLSYNNKERFERMKNRFTILNINCKFYQGVSFDDPRIKNREEIQKVWSCAYGHFDMINDFYNNSTKEYGIFCEDDIIIDKDLNINMIEIINDYKEMNLDVLILGYFSRIKIDENLTNYSGYNFGENLIKINENKNFKYFHYPDYIWGTQMYLISKQQAKILLDKYYNGYAEKTLDDKSLTPFSSDWTITKDGKRGLITPVMAIEENIDNYVNYIEHPGQYFLRVENYSTHFGDRFIV